jgi:hypothetical protein
MIKYVSFVIVAAGLLAGCTKDPETSIGGKGGNAVIAVYPQHHQTAKDLISMKVYVKYNTLDAPANSIYDDSATCTYNEAKAVCSFTSLKNGNYYFYSTGYDTVYKQPVKGGTPYTVSKQEAQQLNVPVSEY